MYSSDRNAAQVVTGSGLVGELSALELGRNFQGCMRGLAIGGYSDDDDDYKNEGNDDGDISTVA